MGRGVGFSFPSFGVLLLYAVTVVLELPVVFARMLLVLVTAVLLLLLTGHAVGRAESLVELGLIPTAWAVFALVTPFGGGWWWRQNLGGRKPSERE